MRRPATWNRRNRVHSQVAEPRTRLASARPEVTVDLALSRDAIRSKVAGWRIRFLPRREGAASASLRHAIIKWAQGSGSDPYPPELPGMMVDRWPELRAALAELLDAAELTTRLQRNEERPDLLVRIADGALQPLPWELAVSRRKPGAALFADFRRAYRTQAHAAPDTRMIRVVQAGLNLFGSSIQVERGQRTGYGQGSSRSLPGSGDGAFQGRRSRDGPVAAPGPAPGRASGRDRGPAGAGQGRRPNLAAERRYAYNGFEASTVDQGQISTLTRLLRVEPPPVIVHIVGGLVVRVGVTAIDLQEDAAGWGTFDTAGLLTVADLDHALRAVPRDWPAPVVVLDVPAPTGHREVADQMLLRNCFAADLFAMGGTRAVVATGVAERATAGHVQDVLVEGLAQGKAIGDVVQEMRQQVPSWDFDKFGSSAAFAGTALWSSDPSMRLPNLGGT